MADKEALLASIAQAGTAGKQAYLDAQAKLKAQQDEAIRMALSGSLAGSVPAAAQAQLAARIAEPYQSRTASLTQNQAGVEDYYGRIGTNAGVYMDQVNTLGPALRQQYEQALALKMADSGGGGGGGGGGSGSTGDWWDALKDTYDTKTNLYKVLRSSGTTRIPGSVSARQQAAELGIPEGVVEAQFPLGEYLTSGLEGLQTAKAKGVPVHTFREVAMKNAASTPGNQATERRYLVDLYRGGPPRKRRKKKRR